MLYSSHEIYQFCVHVLQTCSIQAQNSPTPRSPSTYYIAFFCLRLLLNSPPALLGYLIKNEHRGASEGPSCPDSAAHNQHRLLTLRHQQCKSRTNDKWSVLHPRSTQRIEEWVKTYTAQLHSREAGQRATGNHRPTLESALEAVPDSSIDVAVSVTFAVASNKAVCG